MHQIHRFELTATPCRGFGIYGVPVDTSIKTRKGLSTARFPELQGGLKKYYSGDVCSPFDEYEPYYERKVTLRKP